MAKNETVAPAISQTMQISVPEHEVLLSFNSDEDAILFSDWWNFKGWTQFKKWADVQNKRNNTGD